MRLILHFFGFLPHFSEGQIVSTALVWIGCFVWKAAAARPRVPATAKLDSCLGVRVISGFKVPEEAHKQ
jgi:hypothetical protein